MTISDAAVVGSVPENYDRLLASVLFDPYAEDLAARLTCRPGPLAPAMRGLRR